MQTIYAQMCIFCAFWYFPAPLKRISFLAAVARLFRIKDD